MQPFLSLLKRRPALAQQAVSDLGINLTPEVANALRGCASPNLIQKVNSGEARRLTLTIEEKVEDGIKWRDVRLVLRDENGRGLTGQGMREKAAPVTKQP